MDSNFQVRISADISDLTSRLKAVEVELQKFSKSADKAAGSVKNMEQNANRGRLTAFAFGQVLRDSGFFAQSFSLGILAISNNVPILIDQIALSVKALQPFAGAISIASSVLTAALTIWAYSSQAVNKNTESIEDYINKLDDLRQTQINASASAKSEIIDLENLRKASQNQALSVRDRKKAIDELRDRWPDYYQGLSDETIMAGKDAEAHRKLAGAILAVAKVQANKDKIVLNSKKIDILYQSQQDERLKQEKFLSDELLKVRSGLVKQGIKEDSAYFRNYMAGAKQRIKSTEDYLAFTKKINEDEARRGELLYSNIQLSEDMQKLIATTGTVAISGDYGTSAKESKDIWEDFNNTLKAINLDPTTSEFDKLNKTLDAHRSMLGQLSKETYQGVDEDIKAVTNSMVDMQSQIDKFTKTKQINDLLSQFNMRVKDINGNVGATGDVIRKQMVEAIDDLINKLQQIGGLDALVAKLKKLKDGLSVQLSAMEVEIKNILEGGVLNTISNVMLGIGDAIANGFNIAKSALSAALGSVSNIFQQFGEQLIKTAIETGILAAGIGKAIEAIKVALGSLNGILAVAAGVALIGLAGAARAGARNIANGGSGGGSAAAPATSFGGINSGATRFPTNTSAMAISNFTGQQTLETRVSGNDLVIVMDRASKNRGNYF